MCYLSHVRVWLGRFVEACGAVAGCMGAYVRWSLCDFA